MALYNDKDTPGRLGTFRSTKGAALGSSYRTGTCFVRRGQMSPIMSSGDCRDRRGVKITVGTENIVGRRERDAGKTSEKKGVVRVGGEKKKNRRKKKTVRWLVLHRCKPPNEISSRISRMDTAQAGLSMPRHVPDHADHDIWVAQKPPMLIDRPR
ncbi:hypothetical protein WH47_02965 [Habropoda laboriosa]|uniref:Uncharacterized protein n=1 Tax=Habropoda laboriosa TaxID=597456 RepID=A0A0L7QST2_9HYME|nr:hypothetical protein WH47_02965 [Habropoda laboriosa]